MSTAPAIILSQAGLHLCMFIIIGFLLYVLLVLFHDVIDERKWQREQERAQLHAVQQQQSVFIYRQRRAYSYQTRLQKFRAAPVATV